MSDTDSRMRESIEKQARENADNAARSGKQVNQDSERRRIAALMEKNDRVQRDRRK